MNGITTITARFYEYIGPTGYFLVRSRGNYRNIGWRAPRAWSNGWSSLLLPLSFTIGELNALTLLMSIYQGSMYGGSLTSILINVPGDASSAVTTLDGYQLTKKGKPGIALALSAIGSFIGGTIGFIGLIFLTPYVAKWAYVFGSPEYFALMLFALIATSGLGDKKINQRSDRHGIRIINFHDRLRFHSRY